MTPKHGWLVAQVFGLVLTAAAVFLLAGLAWTLLEAGVLIAAIAEVKS